MCETRLDEYQLGDFKNNLQRTHWCNNREKITMWRKREGRKSYLSAKDQDHYDYKAGWRSVKRVIKEEKHRSQNDFGENLQMLTTKIKNYSVEF